jgi:hypothetical protein
MSEMPDKDPPSQDPQPPKPEPRPPFRSKYDEPDENAGMGMGCLIAFVVVALFLFGTCALR